MSILTVNTAPTEPETSRVTAGSVAAPVFGGVAPLRSPAAEAFPAFPSGWYRFGASSELAARPVVREMIGRRLVAFRSGSGAVGILESRCPHQGGDLGRGVVVGESLRCPFHSWEWDVHGRCTAMPGRATVASMPCHLAYPTAERHGSVYFFNDRHAEFPLPFFRGERVEDFVAARPIHLVCDAPWFMIANNAFDFQHLSVVHHRALIGEPEVDTPEPFARRSRYRIRVTGTSVYDRLVSRFAGEEASVEICVWAGSTFTVRAAFRNAVSYLYFNVEPAGPSLTRLHVSVYRKRSSRLGATVDGLAAAVALEIRRIFTRGFLLHEIHHLGSLRYVPGVLTEEDRPVIEYLRWLASLHNG